ncbi:hypothetical protein M0220_05160 [Halomonas qinghailakensis]|uniref:Uncharacterized protein n=1 Tax=Halomonas qinghailakensis TaxID=2937790 RepID=A0AA46YRF6_9GAMM|nr:hypothetical protein [Halomonas sp. ZZQ-149]UYO75548.1 hypothetical protein M0220_05160 [Halomonas sp. ZZQ-149]
MDKGLKWIISLALIASSNASAISLENNIKSHEFKGNVFDFLLSLEVGLVDKNLIVLSVDDETIREGCSKDMFIMHRELDDGERHYVCADEVLINIATVTLTGSDIEGVRWGLEERQRISNAFNKEAAGFLCDSQAIEDMILRDIQSIRYKFEYNGFYFSVGSCNSNLFEKLNLYFNSLENQL